MLGRLLESVGGWVATRPRGVLVALGLVTAAAALALPRLRVDPDVAAFLPHGDPRVELLTDDGLAGRSGQRLWIALLGAGAGAHVPAVAERLAALPDVAHVLAERDELLGRGDALPALQRLSAEALARVAARLEPEGRRAAMADLRRTLAEDPLGGQQRALRDPLGLRWALEGERAALPLALDPASPYLVLADGATALVGLEGTGAPFDVDLSTRLVDGVEAALAAEGFTPGEDALLVGGYAAARGDAQRIRHDLTSSLLWSVPLVLLFLTLSARSLVLPHLYLVPVLVAIVWTLGFGGLVFGALTPLALSSAAILTGLGVDFAIHLAERWREERAGADAATATRVALATTGRGLVAGMLTSAAAFLSFATSSIPGLASFGGLLALGLVSALVVTLLLEPLLLARLAPRAPARARSSPVVRAALRLSHGRAGGIAALALCALGLAGWGLVAARGLRFDADPAALRPDDAGVARAAAAIAERLGFSPVPVRVLVPVDAADADRLAAAAERLHASDAAALVVGPHDVLASSTRRAQLEDLRARAATLVDDVSADLTAAGFRPEPFEPPLAELAERLAEPVTTDAASFRVRSTAGGDEYWRVDVYGAGDLRDAERREALRSSIGAAYGDDVLVADPHGIGDVVTPVLRRELAQAVAEAAGLVLLCVVLGVGGLRRGLVAMVPAVVGFGLTLGVLVWFGVALTPGNLMAVPLILGLGVDDGVHLSLRRGEGRPALAATGDAIWRTSATTAIGFGSLVTARTPAIASLGGITLLGVAATLAASLVVLPALWARGRAGAE